MEYFYIWKIITEIIKFQIYGLIAFLTILYYFKIKNQFIFISHSYYDLIFLLSEKESSDE